MSRRLILTILSLAMLFCTGVSAQETHIQREYSKNAHQTAVRTDSLYVINQPTQFMQLQFEGRYRNEGPPAQMPYQITLEIFSFALAPLYRNDEKHHISVRADEKTIDFGLMTYVGDKEGELTSGEWRNPREEGKSKLGIGAPLPSDAALKKKDKDLAHEWMSLNVTLTDITALAKAQRVIMKIGPTIFALTPVHMAILREFVGSITPVGNPKTPEVRAGADPVPADVPSDSNGVPLAKTLEWLKRELTRNGKAIDAGSGGRFETSEFKTCKISYRIIPTTYDFDITEIRLNLADLNPESVRIEELDRASVISFDTRDHALKITETYRDNESGMPTTVWETKSVSGGSIVIATKAAMPIKEAFVHAIKLCQAKP